MYVHDDIADAAIAKCKTLRDVVQGKTLMLFRPGTLATVAGQCCLMFGGIGLVGTALWLGPPSTERFKYCFFFGLLPLAVLTAGLFHGVVRGWPLARAFNYRFALALCVLSVGAELIALAQWKSVSMACGAISLVCHLAAVRLIAGEGYAVTSALFRAQRARMRAMSGL